MVKLYNGYVLQKLIFETTDCLLKISKIKEIKAYIIEELERDIANNNEEYVRNNYQIKNNKIVAFNKELLNRLIFKDEWYSNKIFNDEDVFKHFVKEKIFIYFYSRGWGLFPITHKESIRTNFKKIEENLILYSFEEIYSECLDLANGIISISRRYNQGEYRISEPAREWLLNIRENLTHETILNLR